MQPCQKRPTIEVKETYYRGKRDLIVVTWQRGDGPGFSDPEAFFMVGHDAQTCMAIRR
jgi:hypothetical protein